MQVQEFIPEKHYQTLVDWWTGHKWPRIPLESLSKTGLVCYVDETPVCSAFLYKSDSDISWLEWLLCDPKANRKYRSDCLNYIIEQIEKLSVESGHKFLFTSISHPSLQSRLEKKGFTVSDTNVTNLLKVL